MAAFLALVGVVVLVDASRPAHRVRCGGPGGHPGRSRCVVGALLVVCAVLLAVDVAARRPREAEGGEDVDLDHPSDWRTVGCCWWRFVANIVLIDLLGWVISGAMLFWGALRPRQPAPTSATR